MRGGRGRHRQRPGGIRQNRLILSRLSGEIAGPERRESGRDIARTSHPLPAPAPGLRKRNRHGVSPLPVPEARPASSATRSISENQGVMSPDTGSGLRGDFGAKAKATGRAGSGRTDARAAPRPERPRRAGGECWTTRLRQAVTTAGTPPGPSAPPAVLPPGARPGSRCGEPRHPGEVQPCATAAASGFSPPASSSATRKASSSDWVALRRGSQAVW